MYPYLLLYSLVFSLLSCSTISPPSPLKPEWIRNARAMDTLEARNLIEAKKKFLDLTFEETRDLNFNTLKFQPSCLAENRVGKVEEDDDSFLLVAQLMTDKEFHPGLCPGQAESEPTHFAWVFCKRSKKFYELRCLLKDCRNPHWKQLC